MAPSKSARYCKLAVSWPATHSVGSAATRSSLRESRASRYQYRSKSRMYDRLQHPPLLALVSRSFPKIHHRKWRENALVIRRHKRGQFSCSTCRAFAFGSIIVQRWPPGCISSAGQICPNICQFRQRSCELPSDRSPRKPYSRQNVLCRSTQYYCCSPSPQPSAPCCSPMTTR